MCNLRSIFGLMFFISVSLFGADAEKFKYLANPNNVIETECVRNSCPEVKEGYVARVKSMSYQSGETQCYVYENSSNILVGTISNINEKCRDEYIEIEKKHLTTANKALQEDSQTKNIQNNYVDIGHKQKQYFTDFTSTGNKEFIDVSKYMIAGFTLDNKIININESINLNRVVLQNDYTLFGNDTYESSGGWDFLKKIAEFFSGTSTTSTSLLENSAVTSMGATMLADVTVFIMHFMSEYNEQMLGLKSFIIFTIVPFTLLFLVQSKLTKKLAEINDFDDIYERVFFTALTLFIFYFSTTTIKVDNASFSEDAKISQSNFQNWFRNIFYEGSEIATGVARAGTVAYMRYKTQDLGNMSKEHLADLTVEAKMLKTELAEYKNIVDECYKSYNIKALKGQISSLGDSGHNFPSNEIIPRTDGSEATSGNFNAYTDAFLLAGATTKLSVSGCYNAEKEYLSIKDRLTRLAGDSYVNAESIDSNMAGEIQSYTKMANKGTVAEQLNILVDTQFRNSAELGWIAFSMLPTVNIAITELEIIESDKAEDEKEWRNKAVEDSANAQNIGSEDTSLIDAAQEGAPEVLSNIAYMMLPAADNIYNIIKDMEEGTVSLLLELIPISKAKYATKVVAQTGVGSAKVADRKIDTFYKKMKSKVGKIVRGATGALVAVLITVALMKILVVIFPLIGIIMASTMAIAFYFFSIEIYYLVSPFIIAFAMASQQGEIIKKFLKVGVTLALKPIVIVISLVMAIWVYEFFKIFNDVLVDWNFNSIFAIIRADSGLQLSNTFFLTVAQQFIHIGINIVAFVVVFYMVLNGANMIMDMFGLSDANVDMQSSIGSNIDSKTSKWNSGGSV